MSFGFSIGDIIKVYEVALGVYRKCRDCPGEYKILTDETRQLSDRLQDLSDKVEQHKIPPSKVPELLRTTEATVELLKELDGLLNHYASLNTQARRTWDRLNWDPEKATRLRDRLKTQVAILNAFWQSIIHDAVNDMQDNQVLILEALERLEREIQGGHREGSVRSAERLASARRVSLIGGIEYDSEEEDDENAAWLGIIRDLEDLGISKHDASNYRDFIIDWVVRAINEGRLMESSAEEDEGRGSEMWTGDLQLPLPTAASNNSVHRLPSWETPSFPPSTVTRKPIGAPPIHPRVISSDPEPSPASSSARTSPSPRSRSPLATTPQPVSQSTTNIPMVVSPPLENSPSPIPIPQSTVYQSPGPYPSPATPPGQNMYSYPTVNAQPPIIAQQVTLPVTQHPQQFSAQSAIQPLPAHHQTQVNSNSNIIWTTQRIVASWNNRDFLTAEKQLEEQLAAVQRGETITIYNQTGRPSSRLLRHLMGVCASFNGNFLKAKKLFESVQQGPYLNGANLDDGDIAAARWLGDTCLHLNEPQNAGLAWAVALDGLIVRYGISRDTTRRVLEECRMLDLRLAGLTSLSNSFSRYNTDTSDIFSSTPHMDKARLVAWTLDRLKQVPGGPVGTYPHQPPGSAAVKGLYRPRIEWKMAEGFLVQPLISQSAWPLQYDPFFFLLGSINLMARFNSNDVNIDGKMGLGFTYDKVPTVGLGQSKQLDFATKRDVRWLVPALTNGLKEYGIDFKEKGSMIMCRFSQRRDNIVYFEGVGIKVRKLQFRHVWGVKVTESLFQTRVGTTPNTVGVDRDTKGFAELVRGILERAEADEKIKDAEKEKSIGGSSSMVGGEGILVGEGTKISYG